ncbi:hypothetical protein ACOMHN_055820 [Nucella lapillus]
MLALLGAGAKILKDHSETTPLDIACFARDLNIIDSLLLNRDLLDIEGHVRTLFLVLKDAGVLFALLGGGARILTDMSGSTPLDLACEAGDLEIVHSLLLNRDLLGIERYVTTVFLSFKREDTSNVQTLFESVKEAYKI